MFVIFLGRLFFIIKLNTSNCTSNCSVTTSQTVLYGPADFFFLTEMAFKHEKCDGELINIWHILPSKRLLLEHHSFF